MTEAEGFPEGLHSNLVANCAINAFLSFTAIVLNVITIQALRKTASLSKTLKTLLLSLAVSDLGVGLLAQPLYIATLVIKIDQSTLFGCSVQFTSRILRLLGYVFLPASFFGIFALTVDRFLAIHLHLRYQEVVTYKRIVALVITIWVLSSALSILALNKNLEKVLSLGLFVVALCCKMHAVVRRHRNEINSALQVHRMENWQVTQGWKKLHLLHFMCISCFWDVMCHTFAWELLLESLVNLSCDGICCIIFWHWCIWIHLSILWSTVGRCETFDKLWWVYFVTSFKVIKAHLRLVVPLEFWTFYDVISMVCKSVDHGKLWSIY